LFWQRGSELARVCLFVYDPSLFLLNIAQVIERARTIETGVCVHGRGNEFTVRDLHEMNGVVPEARTVIKEPNRAFFGWQTPRHADMSEYLRLLTEYGFRLRQSLELIQLDEDVEITRVRDCTRSALLANIARQVTIGAILKLLTAQLGKRGGIHDFVVTELYSDQHCMVMSDMADSALGPKLCKLLEQGERLYAEHGLMVDPLGGAAISQAIRYLFNPAQEPILSNLETLDAGEVLLTDPGLMNVRDGERVSNIPGTKWAMALALRLVGELSFEAMNMAVRDHGNDIAHRPLGVINAAPKAAAWVGYTCVKIARKFWNSKAGDLAQGLAQEMLVLA